jgi:hypothetical protein
MKMDNSKGVEISMKSLLSAIFTVSIAMLMVSQAFAQNPATISVPAKNDVNLPTQNSNVVPVCQKPHPCRDYLKRLFGKDSSPKIGCGATSEKCATGYTPMRPLSVAALMGAGQIPVPALDASAPLMKLPEVSAPAEPLLPVIPKAIGSEESVPLTKISELVKASQERDNRALTEMIENRQATLEIIRMLQVSDSQKLELFEKMLIQMDNRPVPAAPIPPALPLPAVPVPSASGQAIPGAGHTPVTREEVYAMIQKLKAQQVSVPSAILPTSAKEKAEK